ncbi:alpha/beta hydrolase [Bordetella genomosp. 9]|uniref:Alpha/beta hydrolase n=1 Tax=Bordetella genomosp. 9 TaxID=1416803 RepID=A0A1W6Z105_9BORD|nr:alpha/beta hydrolase [Bordetella genomosp. 9]
MALRQRGWILDTGTFDFEGVQAGYYRAGQGQPLLLLHGSGPGASSIGNWKAVLPRLAERYTVYAMDLVGFGRSGRKPEPPYFDYDMWVRQAGAMLARIPGDRVGVVAHSLSASIALTMAASDRRAAAIMTTGAMGAPFDLNEDTVRTWTCPRNRQQLVQALSGLIHDTSGIDEAYLQAREQVIFADGYADYFDDMFRGDKQQYIDAAVLSGSTLARVTQPVLMLHGLQDQAFPASSTREVAARLADVDVALLGRCSHSVAVERADTFIALAFDFFGRHLGGA